MNLTKDHPNVQKFFKHVADETQRYGISVHFGPGRSVSVKGTDCNGYFEQDENLLAVATGQPFEKWFPVFVHEYSHFTQWRDNCLPWQRFHIKPNITTEHIIELWLEHKIELSPEKLHDYIGRSRDIELDCEQRTVAHIKQFDLPVDLDSYIKGANAYAMFWSWMEFTRKWYDIGNEPYNNEKLLQSMPTGFIPYEDFDNMKGDARMIYRDVFGFKEYKTEVTHSERHPNK